MASASVSFGHNNSGLQVGVNHGPIYLSPGRSEPHPRPLSMVPFPRNPDFVGREELLEQIHEKASIAGSRIALVGLGGVGKTQLATEYCHQVRLQSAKTWVFWVHASNAARCEKSLRDLADRVKIPRCQDRNSNIFQIVSHWLQDGNIGNWILVLDNVDDDEILRNSSTINTESQRNTQTSASTQPPLRYLFECFNGSIIVTSRNRGVALNVASHENIIEVKPMSQGEGLSLLQKKLSPLIEQECMVQLARELEYMPLAIVQAASYITHRSPCCSVSQYLERIQKCDRDAVRVLNYEAGLLHRDWEAKNSILLTWQISFDYIRDKWPSAADLLSVMSFFNWQGIAQDLLRIREGRKEGQHLSLEETEECPSEQDTDDDSNDDADDDAFEKNLTILCDFSLIAVGGDSTSFTMHRLVQLTIRTWLKSHGLLEKWKEIFIRILFDSFPTAEYENWKKCRPLFPHVKAAVSHQPESPVSVQQWATLLYRGAWFATESGYFSESIEMASTSRKYRLKMFGAENKQTIDSTAMLARAYRLMGRWKEAEQLEVQVVATRTTKLGAEHPSTLTSMADLASTYGMQERWGEAERLGLQVMDACKTQLGGNHRATLSSMNNLAVTCLKQGRWDEAEQLFWQVMKINIATLGTDHPDTLTTMDNLASTYRNQGRWKEAEQLEVQVMETSKTKLGADHPFTLTSMANLASTYASQGRWEEVEQLEMQVMERSKKKFGADHPDTLTSMANLASTYASQGRREEAEQLLVQVLEISKTKFGAEHPSTLISMNNLALMYTNQGRCEEAEQLFVQVVEKSKTTFGAEHPSTLTSMNNLALTRKEQGRWREAEQLGLQVMEISKTKLGADHPDTLTSMNNLASTYASQSRWKEAEQLGLQVVEARKMKLGAEHPSTLTSMNNLASIYKKQGRWKEAEQLGLQVVEARKMKLGAEHASTLRSMANLASTYKKQGRWEEAERLEVQILETARRSSARTNPMLPQP